MKELLKKYSFELISAAVILMVFIIILPKNNIDIPNIEDIQLTGLDMTFVSEDSGSLVPEVDEIIVPVQNTGVQVNTGLAINNTGSVSINDILDLPVSTPPQTTPVVSVDTSEPQNCKAPRWQLVEHGKSVLAYQQRTDDNTICNIQRRLCTDGVLAGSYMQRSCKELYQWTAFTTSRWNTNDNYLDVSSPSSTSTADDLIQPKPPTGTGRNFNTRGQLDNLSDSQTTWTNGVYSPGISTPSVSQVVKQTPSQCITPRNTLVTHGQFVKAYKYNNGFSNIACEVELRYCVNGTLEGNFAFQECIPNDIAVEDFLNNYWDPEVPSLMQLVETLYATILNPQFAQDYPDVESNTLLEILQTLLQ